MSEINFLNLLLTGYFKNPDLLKDYLIRKCKDAEQNHNYTFIEFYDNCNIVLDHLESSFFNEYYQRAEQLELVKKKLESNNQSTKDIDKEIEFLNIYRTSIPLVHITKQQFTGHLNYSDVEFIKDTIKNILDEIEKKDERVKYEVKENEYKDIFKNNIGYSIFLELHQIYKDKNNTLANYSFLFYALQKNYLVCNGRSFISFLASLDIHIDKIDSRQSGSNYRSNLFKSIEDKFIEAR